MADLPRLWLFFFRLSFKAYFYILVETDINLGFGLNLGFLIFDSI
ncbi:hypothetical protein B488_13460 [Liberibacter crescens BT-1]|uniref:Uncharacterized protein n=1 Tax=Liberibacter crescens (strain BT-1) TaxID=1215343 RepID=L0EXE5_LIBCB|nr:hypothetical protein B488_13460 [Liberibacter crescens BT-1]